MDQIQLGKMFCGLFLLKHFLCGQAEASGHPIELNGLKLPTLLYIKDGSCGNLIGSFFNFSASILMKPTIWKTPNFILSKLEIHSSIRSFQTANISS